MPRIAVVVIAVFLTLVGQPGPARAEGFLRAVFHRLRPRLAPKEVRAGLKFQYFRRGWLQRATLRGKASAEHAGVLDAQYREARWENTIMIPRGLKWGLRGLAAFNLLFFLHSLGDPQGATGLWAANAAGAALGGQAADITHYSALKRSRVQAIDSTRSILLQKKNVDSRYVRELEVLKREMEEL